MGKASTNIDAWGVSVRGEFEGTDFSKAALEIDATNPDAFDLHVDASAGDGFSVHKIEATKTIDSDGAEVTINPRYNVETEEGDVVVTYSKDGTEVELTASQDAQSVNVEWNDGAWTANVNMPLDGTDITGTNVSIK